MILGSKTHENLMILGNKTPENYKIYKFYQIKSYNINVALQDLTPVSKT